MSQLLTSGGHVYKTAFLRGGSDSRFCVKHRQITEIPSSEKMGAPVVGDRVSEFRSVGV
jgi:hypothetical protein